MKSMLMWALVALNVLLLVSLVGRMTGDDQAMAQAGGRRPAEVVLIPGEIPGGGSGVVYMLDTSNGTLGAMAYDDARKELNVMPTVDLARVFEAGATTVTPGRRGGGSGAVRPNEQPRAGERPGEGAQPPRGGAGGAGGNYNTR